MHPSEPQRTKQVYHPPRLTVYGKVRDLTQGKPITTPRGDGSGGFFNNKS